MRFRLRHRPSLVVALAVLAVVSALATRIPDFTLRATLQGEPPSPIDLPRGCRFQARCPLRQSRCEESEPTLVELAPGHHVACFEAR